MNAGSHDQKILEALSPRDVAGWLRMRGFEYRDPFGEFGAIFARQKDGEDQELILSTSPQARDFSRRMSELVEDLSSIEGRDRTDVLTDLTLAPFDVIKVRSPDADDYGSVRLSTGIDLHSEAKNLVLAAANAAASPTPRRSWRGRRFDEVTEYLENVRLGQSQRGSFVLNILSPWDFTPHAEPAFDVEQIAFGRRVTKSLATALRATEIAIRRAVSGSALPIVDAYKSGVSSNLCLALAKLAREGEGVDISVGWSPVQPEEKLTSIKLKREDAAVLTEAAKQLSQQEPEPNVTLDGLIAGINEDPERFDGSAVIETLINGSIRRVSVDFGIQHRDMIYEAAKSKKWVRMVGDLHQKGRRLTLNNPRDIAVIEAGDMDDLLTDLE